MEPSPCNNITYAYTIYITDQYELLASPGTTFNKNEKKILL